MNYVQKELYEVGRFLLASVRFRSVFGPFLPGFRPVNLKIILRSEVSMLTKNLNIICFSERCST